MKAYNLSMTPWKTPVFNAQSVTFSVARKHCNDYRGVTPIQDHMQPPFCLRTVASRRTPEIQAFRDLIAGIVKQQRALK